MSESMLCKTRGCLDMAMHMQVQGDDTCCAGRVQGNPNYGLQYSASPFGFAVTRVGSSTAALFNTAGNRIVFKVRGSALRHMLLQRHMLRSTLGHAYPRANAPEAGQCIKKACAGNTASSLCRTSI